MSSTRSYRLASGMLTSYFSASALVMPSLTEGLPITLLEAMSLKTPVVASAVGEIPKVLGDGQGGGLLRDIEPETITRALAEAVTDAELSRDKGMEVCTPHH